MNRKPEDKKRKQKATDTNFDESDYFSDHSSDNSNNNSHNQNSRKSKRLQTQLSTSPTHAKCHKIVKASLDSKLSTDRFVAAASAGNFNVAASIGTTSIVIDGSSNGGSSLDLNHLSQNVDKLNSTLKQHSKFLKQLNNSIEKLSHKLDSSSGSSSSSKASAKPSAYFKRRILASRKSVAGNNCKEEIRNQAVDSEEDEQTETINEPAIVQLPNHKEIIHMDEIESINPNSKVGNSNDECIEDVMGSELVAQVLDTDTGTDNNVALVKMEENRMVVIENGNEQHQSDQAQAMVVANDFQTVKLTNSMLEMEKECAGNNGGGGSGLRKEAFYSSDSSKSDDEEGNPYDDELDNNSYENYKSDRQISSTKSPSSNNKTSPQPKAILNKTKIDTEFISKLIENKDPNDKRYDPNEINKLRLLSHSYQNFAVKLLMRLFDEEEIIGRNVYGRNYSGDKSFLKQPLDSDRINFIRETVLRLTRTNNPELAWASCVIAMNRKMVDINNKFIKSNTTSTKK